MKALDVIENTAIFFFFWSRTRLFQLFFQNQPDITLYLVDFEKKLK